MSEITPAAVLRQVSDSVPTDCRKHVVIIGSLAAGYHFFGDDAEKAVRTKDVDFMLEPFHAAVGAGQKIARQLLAAGWRPKGTGGHHAPGDANTPEDQLPAVRLYPPGMEVNSERAWFIELLTVPEPFSTREKEWTRLELDGGHYGLPSFRYLLLAAHSPLSAGDMGIRYARPEMMALSNLLHHPIIGTKMIEGTNIKRSCKDLGRVLALAVLADLDDYRAWGQAWRDAMETCFPQDWMELARRVGGGLRALLRSEADLRQAHQTCITGLLASQPPGMEALRAAGERLEVQACEWLERSL
jgi:hypothetical protein